MLTCFAELADCEVLGIRNVDVAVIIDCQIFGVVE